MVGLSVGNTFDRDQVDYGIIVALGGRVMINFFPDGQATPDLLYSLFSTALSSSEFHDFVPNIWLVLKINNSLYSVFTMCH